MTTQQMQLLWLYLLPASCQWLFGPLYTCTIHSGRAAGTNRGAQSMDETSERYLRNIRRVTDVVAVVGIILSAATGNTSFLLLVLPAICMWLYVGLLKLLM